jgi:hypothetical protein
MSRANLRRLYSIASQDQKNQGFLWYPNANAIASELIPENPRAGSGLLASLSPQKSWDQNVYLARLAVSQGFASGHYSVQTKKADYILAGGEFSECLAGMKERSFAECIAAPWEDCGFVCLDRHAINAWHGYLCEDKARARFAASKLRYVRVAEDFRAVSRELGILPSQLQAILWIVWRDLCAGSRGPFRLDSIA